MLKKFILLLLFAFQFANAQSDLSSPVKIPFTVTGAGHIMIKATVNGTEGNFIFDTGAGLNLVTKKFADKVNLTKTQSFYTGHRATGEALEVDLYDIKSLQLAGFTDNNQQTAVLDIDFPLDGLISLMPFKNNAITIDYTTKNLIIENGASLKKLVKKNNALPIQISEDGERTLSISTKVKLNSKLTLQVGLDSGAGANIFRFNSRYIETLELDKSKLETKYVKSDFNPEHGNNFYRASLTELATINNTASVKEIPVTFIEGLIYEGILCTNWLGDKITIDVKGKRILVN
ncbi:hypothetical protein AMR72_11915 [Flavobacterium psychrophilum]|nr:hypothetical protein AMR72_11915 [Flavobacterium psychrophilum]AOE53163.1 hypothetical protein ALW18_11905 [Flavobacterium psychrophilum]